MYLVAARQFSVVIVLVRTLRGLLRAATAERGAAGARRDDDVGSSRPSGCTARAAYYAADLDGVRRTPAPPREPCAPRVPTL
jgi:hypothetical protein